MRQKRSLRRNSKRLPTGTKKQPDVNSTFHKKEGPKEVGRTSSPEKKMIGNMIPAKATHSSLELIEKPALPVAFDGSFCQKLRPVYSPNGSMLEFQVAGDRNNYIDYQKNFLKSSARLYSFLTLI